MVSTRKTPTAPTSRANSSQSSVPRTTQAKAPTPATAPTNGEMKGGSKNAKDQVASKKGGKQKGKAKEKKGNKSKRKTSLVDLLARFALLWFTIYTLSVCPEDDHLKSPVCRGLYHYRRLILEPYIFPPIEAALKHPSVAPYYDAVKPHIQHAYVIAQPFLAKGRAEFNEHILPQWEKRVIPAWEQIVLPQIKAHVIPQFNKHALPYLKNAEAHLGPYKVLAEREYHTRLAQYNHQLAPHLHTVIVHAGQLERAARPYVILAGQKAYEGYVAAKPYAAPAWEKFKEYSRQLLAFLAVQRREFVDPHVAKIWEKVREHSGISPVITIPRITPSVKGVSSPVSPLASSTSSVVAPSAANISSSPGTHDSAIKSPSGVIPDTVESTTPLPSSSTTSLASAASPIISSYLSEAASAVSSSAEQVTSAASSVVTSIASGSSSIVDKLKDGATPSNFVPEDAKRAAESVSSAAASEATPTGTASSTGDAELDDFFADIGMSEDDTPLEAEAAEETATTPAEHVETEEEKAERLAKVAAKRADITGRHTQWEQQLEAQILKGEEAFRAVLEGIRKEGSALFAASNEIRGEVESLVSDSEKYLKGAESYLRTLEKDDKSKAEKVTLWDRVLEKIEAKFTKRLQDTETIVNTWYDDYHTQELQEADKHAGEARAIADRAQENLGMDYAWLDDVTYMDWQRYHDLVRRSDNYTRDLGSILDDTHATPVANPVRDALRQLQNEVEEVATGFQTRLRRLNRDGVRSFDDAVPAPKEDEPVEVPVEVPVPEVSILPIPGNEVEPGVDEVPPVVIGRGKEEILEALGRAAHESSDVNSSPTGESQKAHEENAGGPGKEAEGAQTVETPIAVVHAEL